MKFQKIYLFDLLEKQNSIQLIKHHESVRLHNFQMSLLLMYCTF